MMIHKISNRYQDYLSDESGLKGKAQSISFPSGIEDIHSLLKELKDQPVTVQGSRTGISGGAVPAKGHILNLSAMTQILELKQGQGHALIRVQPGVTLNALQARLNKTEWVWPVMPTETDATIGGIAANNAAGPISYGYGPAVDHIQSISVMEKSGRVYTLGRPEFLPFMGSEGMVGIITELVLKLSPGPRETWGVVFFFDNSLAALGFALDIHQSPAVQPAALEYMDNGCLNLIRKFQSGSPPKKQLPEIKTENAFAIALEFHGNNFDDLEPQFEYAMERAAALGSNPEHTWAFSGEGEMNKLHDFFHCPMQSFLFSARQSAGGILPGLDVNISPGTMGETLNGMTGSLKHLYIDIAIFGGMNRGLRLGLIPRCEAAYLEAGQWVEKLSKNNRTPVKIMAGYGLGKVNHRIMAAGPIQKLKTVILAKKKETDPRNLLNPGNMEHR